MKKNRVISFSYIVVDFLRVTGAPLLLWFRVKRLFISEEAKKKIKGGAILISNHISLADPMYLLLAIWYRRHHFVAMQKMFNTKFKKWLFTKVFHCIEVNRDNVSIKTFKDINNHIKNGKMVTMFPEGHINIENDGVNAFKSGMIMMAAKSGCPIIPVYIKRRKHWYSRLVVGIGEHFEMIKFSSSNNPTLEEIDNAAKYLQEEEHKLELLCNEGEIKNDGQ